MGLRMDLLRALINGYAFAFGFALGWVLRGELKRPA